MRDNALHNRINSTEVIHTTRDGREVYLLATTNAITDREGKTIGFVSVFHDITERKSAEKALRQGEERLRLAASVPSIVLSEVDMDLRYM